MKTKYSVACFVDNTFNDERFLKLRMRVCHDGLCPNKVFLTKETMEKANSTMGYIPILANTVYEDGVPVLGQHDMHVEEDKLNPGQGKLIYDEAPVGVVPSAAENNCTIEEHNGRNYTCVDAYIWRKYSNYVADILEQQDETKISMEISIPDGGYAYNAKENYTVVEEYVYDGITLLNNKYGTGMADAEAKTLEFSADDAKDQMTALMEELKSVLQKYADGDNTEEPETEEPVEANDDTPVDGEEKTEETGGEEPSVENEGDPVEEPEVTEDPETVTDDDAPKKKYSSNTKTFTLSFDEIESGLYQLLADVEAQDNEYYLIDKCYSNHFDYRGWLHGKIYRQNYKKKGDLVQFDGERVEMFDVRCTAAERDHIETMRNTYAQMKADLEQYRAKEQAENERLAEEKKIALFNQSKYAILNGYAPFEELKKDHKEITFADLEIKVKVLHSDFVTAHPQTSSMRSTFGLGVALSGQSNASKDVGVYKGMEDLFREEIEKNQQR